MKYLIAELEIKTAERTNNEYISMLLMNEDDPFDSPVREAIFNQNLVNYYKSALTTAGNDITKLPDNIRYFHYAELMTKTFATPMFRRWGNAGKHWVIDAAGNRTEVEHGPNDFIKDASGQNKLYYGCTFLVKRKLDKEKQEMGYPIQECLGWAKDWSPEDRLKDLIGRTFVLPSEYGMVAQQNPSQPPVAPQAPVVPQGQTPQQQPSVQQAPGNPAPGVTPPPVQQAQGTQTPF